MKTFKQFILNEALDKPYRVNVKGGEDRGYFFYTFTTDDGRRGTVDAIMTYLDTDEKTNTAHWGLNVSFDINDSISRTGGGDQFRILATARKGLEHAMGELGDSVKRLTFSAGKENRSTDDGSRVKLYRRFAKKIAKRYGMSMSEKTGRDDITFIMTRR